MKRLLIGCCIIIAATISCVRYNGNNISVEVQETDNTYSFHGLFNKKKTIKVQRYMDEQLGSSSNVSFVNTQMDATITLDDHTTMYIKSRPGELGIKLDKNKNSFASYTRVKEMCLELKDIMAKNGD